MPRAARHWTHDHREPLRNPLSRLLRHGPMCAMCASDRARSRVGTRERRISAFRLYVRRNRQHGCAFLGLSMGTETRTHPPTQGLLTIPPTRSNTVTMTRTETPEQKAQQDHLAAIRAEVRAEQLEHIRQHDIERRGYIGQGRVTRRPSWAINQEGSP
jgi:hypothetical protein